MNTPAQQFTDALNALRNSFKALPGNLPLSSLNSLFSTTGSAITQPVQTTLTNLAKGTQKPPTAAQLQTQLAQLQTQLQTSVGRTAPSAAPVQAIGQFYSQIFNFYGALLAPGALLPPAVTPATPTSRTSRAAVPVAAPPSNSGSLYQGPYDPLATVLTPGADVVFTGFGPYQILFARTGDDTIYPFDHSLNTVSQVPTHIDAMFGDTESVVPSIVQDLGRFLLTPDRGQDPSLLLGPSAGLAPTGRDRFVLGDWKTSYYNKSGADDFAFIFDFNRRQDAIQLRGSAQNYVSVEIPLLGTAIFEKKSSGSTIADADLVGVVFSNYNLDLNSSYFKYVAPTPPGGPVQPKIKQIGTGGLDIPSAITTDNLGNVYTLGVTNGLLGDKSQGSYDFVLTKYDNQGNQVWVKQVGTPRFDTPAFGLKTDQAGNIFVVGSFIEEAVIQKYKTADGSFVWERKVEEGQILTSTSNVAIDDVGNIYVSGFTLKPDPRPATDPNRVLDLQDDFWAAKYDTNGVRKWFTEVASPVNSPGLFDETYGISVYTDPVTKEVSVYTTGWTFGDFSGQGKFNSYDVPIAKFNGATGKLEKFSPNPGQLVNQFGSLNQDGTPAIDFAWQVGNDSKGNVYTMGRTTGNLGGRNAGKEDVWLAKNRPNGTQEWVRQFGTSEVDSFYFGGLAIDKQDNIFLSGFTSGSLGGANAGSFDAWVARYDTSGNQKWIKQFGTAQLDYATSVAVDNNGSIFVTGFTEGSLGAVNKGAEDTWIAKLDINGNLLNFNGGPSTNLLSGKGGQKSFTVNLGNTLTITDFGGVGRGVSPTAPTIAEADTLIFKGSNLTAQNMVLEQIGADLAITFDNGGNTKVLLKNFALENLENLRRDRSASVDLGNILFNGQTKVEDGFDVYNADWQQNKIYNSGTVTFLNDLDNVVNGGEYSDDVINGQGGNDKIYGLSGNDLLRGGLGNDYLDGGSGDDRLSGGRGADSFVFNSSKPFTKQDLGKDVILDFTASENDQIVLSKNTFTAIKSTVGNGFSTSTDFAVVANGSAAGLSKASIVYDSSSGGLYYNQNGTNPGFGSGDLFATLANKPTLTASNFRVLA
jgi:Ca2+-binding RTX toxin-like protein